MLGIGNRSVLLRLVEPLAHILELLEEPSVDSLPEAAHTGRLKRYMSKRYP